MKSFINFAFFLLEHLFNLIGDPSRSLEDRIFKDILHNLGKNLIVAILNFHFRIIDLIGEGDQFVDDLHDIFRVVSVFSVLDCDIISDEKVEIIALSVIDNWYFWFYPFAYSFASGLGVFSAYVIEYLIALLVDKFH